MQTSSRKVVKARERALAASKFSVFLMAAFFVFGAYATPSAFAAPCTLTYPSGSTPPTGFGASYAPYTSAKELLLNASCPDSTTADVEVGSGKISMYVYQNAYYWTGTTWKLFSLSGTASGSSWLTGTGSASIPLLSNGTRYFVGYTCERVGSSWKCGCKDAACTTPAWQLQGVASTGIDAVSVLDFGAKGDGITDDTKAFEQALAQAKVVEVPGTRTYRINQLRLSSGTTLVGQGATLKLSDGQPQHTAVIGLDNVEYITIRGLIIDGNRDAYSYDTSDAAAVPAPFGGGGDNGGMHAIRIHGARHVLIEDVTLQNAYTDGLKIERHFDPAVYPEDITVRRTVHYNNRRQGMSIIQGKNMHFEDNIYSHTHGQAPEAGVDLEPNNNASVIENVTFLRCRFEHNASAGFMTDIKGGLLRNLEITKSVFAYNKRADNVDLQIVGRVSGGTNPRFEDIVVRDTQVERLSHFGSWGTMYALQTDVLVERNWLGMGVSLINHATGSTATFKDNCMVKSYYRSNDTGLALTSSNNAACSKTVLPFNLRTTGVAEATATVPVTKPADTDSAVVTIRGYDVDDSAEGELYINGNGPLVLFGTTLGANDKVSDVALETPAAWWQTGDNALHFIRTGTAGYAVQAVDVRFR